MLVRWLFKLAGYATLAAGASLKRINSFGSTPTSLQMYLYVPDKVADKPAIILARHPRGGSATGWYSGTKLPSYADKEGFILIYAGMTHMSNLTFHGMADGLVRPECAEQALLQWSNALGVQLAKNVSGVPSAAYTQEIYGDGTKLQGFFGKGVGHIAPVNEQLLLKFFGIIQ